MATLGIPNLCGANPDLENVLGKINNMADEITANLNLDASVAAAAVQAKLDEGLADLKKLVPELPSLPSTNLQAEITSLLALSPTSLTYAASLAKITADFGDALTKKGLSLDTLLKDGLTKIAAGGDVCGLVPNMEIQPNSTEVKEKAATSGLASTDPIKEIPAVVKTAIAVANKANAELATRKDDVAALAKTALKEISTAVGTIDRASGTISPAMKTALKEMDAAITQGKAQKNVGTPQSVRQKNHNAAVSNLEPKSVTGSDTGTNTSTTQEPSTPVVDLKKKLLNDLDKAYQKYRDDGRLTEGMAAIKASKRGYPHNIVPGTNKTKMWVWVPHGVPYKDLAPEYQKKQRVEVPKGSGDFYSLNFQSTLQMINLITKHRKDNKKRWKDLIESFDAAGMGLSEMVPRVAKYVKECEERAKDTSAYTEYLMTYMIKPVKVPEQETRTEVVPIGTGVSKEAEDAVVSEENDD